MEYSTALPQERRFRGHTLATVDYPDVKDNEVFVTRSRNKTVQKTQSYYDAPDVSWKDRLRGIPDVQTVPYTAREIEASSSDEKPIFTRVSNQTQDDGGLQEKIINDILGQLLHPTKSTDFTQKVQRSYSNSGNYNAVG